MSAGLTAWHCPVDDCHYTHFEQPTTVSPHALESVFGYGVMAQVAVARQMQRTEDALRAHFDTHKAEDYLRTITRLQQLCRENGVQP